MKHTLATINWRLDNPEIVSTDFFEGISFSSLDTLFIDPKSLNDRWTYDIPVDKSGKRRTYTDNDRGFGTILTRIFRRRRDEASDLLYKAGGVIVCRLHPRGELLYVVSKDGITEQIDRYSWLPSVSLVDKQHQLNFPSNARFIHRTGDDVVLAGTGSRQGRRHRPCDG